MIICDECGAKIRKNTYHHPIVSKKIRRKGVVYQVSVTASRVYKKGNLMPCQVCAKCISEMAAAAFKEGK